MRSLSLILLYINVVPLFFNADCAGSLSTLKFESSDVDARVEIPQHFVNIASFARIETNATCGDAWFGPEAYCIPSASSDRKYKLHCSVCSRGEYGDSFPITNALHDSMTWWQSPTLARGSEFNWVTITLDLRQMYQVAHIIIKSGNSPRPGNWILERSIDGKDYFPWKYFAITQEECRNWIRPQSVGSNATTENDVECLTEFSQLEPINHGEIRISLLSKDPDPVKFSLWEVPEFNRARYVRLRLQKIQMISSTFNGSNNIVDQVESLPPNAYYYSISSITILGSCTCFGYGSRCIMDYESVMWKCSCGSNTCGENCEECCPTFHRLQWPSHAYPAGLVCGKCNCYGHSNSCVYDELVKRRHSNFNGHGVGAICVNCKNQTTGVNCESCTDGFYRSTSNKHAPCIACTCDCLGCSGECVKEPVSGLQGKNAGQCLCREGFSGAFCNKCSPGYYGYPECMICTCHEDENAQQVNADGCNCKMRSLKDWMPVSLKSQTTHGVEVDQVLSKCLYFSAPRTFLRDKINAYGGIVRYVYRCEGTSHDHVNNDDDDEELLPDVIIEGGGLVLGHKGLHSSTQGGSREVKLIEYDWISLGQGYIWNCSHKVKCQEFGTVTRDDFKHTLSRATGLWIRTHCRNHHHGHGRLEMVDISDEQDDGPLSVEKQQHIRGYSCEDCQNKLNDNLCKMCLPSCYGNSCESLKEEFDERKRKSASHNFQSEVVTRCSSRGDEWRREYSAHSSVSNDKKHFGCSRCSCLLCIFEKSFNRNSNVEEDCLTLNGSIARDDCSCCHDCSCPFDKPITKDIKGCAEDSCFEELLLNVHATLHLTDCIGLTFNPWNKIHSMNQSLTELQNEFQKLTFVDVLRSDLSLHQLINVTNNQVEDLRITFDETNTNLSILLDHVKGNATQLHRNDEVIQNVLHQLRRESKTPAHDFNLKSVFDTSRILFERIKSLNVSTYSALKELEAAQSLRVLVSNLIRAPTTKNGTSEMLARIENNRVKFEDIRHFSVDASLVSMETSQLNEQLEQMLSDLKRLDGDVDSLQRAAQECVNWNHTTHKTHEIVKGLKSFYDEHLIEDLTSLSQTLGNKFKKWSKEGKMLQRSLMGALERYGNISREVSSLDEMNFNLSFSTLAQKNEVLQNLKSKLATLLNETLNTSSVLHIVSQFNESIIASIQEHNFTSLDNTLSKADEIIQKFKNISSLINLLNATSEWSLKNVIISLDSLQNNSSASNTSFLLDQITSRIKLTNQSATRIEEIVLSISRNSSDIGVSIINQADKLNLIGRELNITVKSLDANVKELLIGASLMTERVERLKKYEDELTRKVAILKDLLKYARGRAANVHVPLCHKGGCIRSYPLRERSSLSNSIEFSFRTNSADLNQLLLLIHDGANSKFMAVELVGGKVRFSWRVGVETNTMETSEEITFHDELTWYRVRAERIAHVGKLVVHDSNRVGEDEVIERRFQPLMTHFQFKPTMEFFVGGVPHDYQLPVDLSSRDFSGCIGEVLLDEHPVGMFDFQKLFSSSSQTCYGSPLSTKTEHALTSNTFQFDGSGHVMMRSLDELSLESIVVSLTFKSFWRNSFLFGSVNNNTGEFVILGLKDGRIVFKYGWPLRNLRVALVSKHAYNTNQWVKVYARRTNIQGVLRVENEDLKTSVHDSPAYDSLNLSGSSMYFGGVPTYVVHEELVSSFQGSFLGCMKDVTINSVTPHFLDLSEGSHTGMRRGCSQNRITLSGFTGSSSSFLELEFHLESPSPTFSFMFKASSPGALLLLSINEDYQLAFLIQLSKKGGLEVLLRWNERLLRFEHHRNLCDDAQHFLTAYEDQERLKLTVDEVVLRESYVDDLDGFHLSCSNALFVGGVPPDVLEPQLEGTFQSFNGCISELIVNNILLTFENPKSFKNVDIGRCHTQKSQLLQTPLRTTPFSPTSLLRPQSSTTVSHVNKKTSHLTVAGLAQASKEYVTPFRNKFDEIANVLPLDFKKSQHCNFKKAYHYEPHAVSFGASQASYVVLDLGEHTDINRFKISFHMRTYHEEGALLHSSSRDSFAWSISLMLGHLKLVQSHHGEEKQMETKERYNHGHWVQLDISLKNDVVTIVVDKNEEIKFVVNSSGFENLYIGKRPPESYYDFDASAFRGCIANFSINNELIHLANSPNMVGLLPCHSNIEKGAFFDGYAYALFAEHFHFKSFLTISFNMKIYQPNGVLFAMSDFHRFATLVILLDEEQVIFKVSDYDSMYSVESEHCPDCLCDGSWHQVVAELFSDSITIRIDGQISIGTKFGSTMDLELEGRLYIGGNPASIGPLMMPESGDFFSGCLANVRINDEPIDWWNAEELFGVHLGGCPILS